MKRRIVIFFTLLFFVVASIHAPQANAQTFWPDMGFAESRDAAEAGDVNAAAHVVNVNANNYSDLIRRILGPIPGLTTNMAMNSPSAKQMLSLSAIYTTSSYIATLYTSPPASTYAFVQDIGQTLGFMPKKTYAQGIGFSGLSALLPIWKMFRNISYFLLAIVMVIIGFMVMFRKKIDPKTVISVQNALPGIVIALLLITFSYAIVGIIIDIMYILMALIIQLLSSAANATTPNTFNASVLSDYMTGGMGTVWNGLFGQLGGFPELLKFLGIPTWTDTGLGPVADIIVNFILNPLAAPINIILVVLISLGYLFAFVRIFFMLLSAYIQVIVSLLTAPLQLLLVAIPGSKVFESWIKNLFSHIITFPLTAIFLMIGIILTKSSTQLWTPPLLGFGNRGITAVLALGIGLSIPSVIGSIKEALKAKPMVNVGMGSAVAPIVSGGGQLMQLGYQLSFMKQAFKKPDTKEKPPKV